MKKTIETWVTLDFGVLDDVNLLEAIEHFLDMAEKYGPEAKLKVMNHPEVELWYKVEESDEAYRDRIAAERQAQQQQEAKLARQATNIRDRLGQLARTMEQ